MSKPISTKLRNLDKDPILEEVLYLADYIYDQSGVPEFSDDERWRLARELKDVAIYLITDTASAVGNDGLSGTEYLWGSVRKQASRLKAIYRFAGKRRFLGIDPDIMVRLNKFIKLVDKEIVVAVERTDAVANKDLDIWVKNTSCGER